MKEYIKLFATPQDADGFEVWDFPFIAAVKSTNQLVHASISIFTKEDISLCDSDGVINFCTSYPEITTGYNSKSKTKITTPQNPIGCNIIKIGTNVSILKKKIFGTNTKTDTEILVVPSSITGCESDAHDGKAPFSNFTNLKQILWEASYPIESDLTDPNDAYTERGIGTFFYNCDLENCVLIIGENITSIGSYGFHYTKFRNIICPDELSIGQGAFKNSRLKKIVLPSNLGSIPVSCFENSSALNDIVIPDTVKTIGFNAFSGCTQLESVTVPDSVESIGISAFSGVINVIYNGQATGSPWGAICRNGVWNGELLLDSTGEILVYCKKSASGNLMVPDTVSSVRGSAFSGCTQLESVTVPDSVESIGTSAFSDVTGLVIITTLYKTYTNAIGATSIKILAVDENTFSDGYNASVLFTKGANKSTKTYTVYTDDQTVYNQLSAAAEQYTIFNLYHLDETPWT